MLDFAAPWCAIPTGRGHTHFREYPDEEHRRLAREARTDGEVARGARNSARIQPSRAQERRSARPTAPSRRPCRSPRRAMRAGERRRLPRPATADQAAKPPIDAACRVFRGCCRQHCRARVASRLGPHDWLWRPRRRPRASSREARQCRLSIISNPSSNVDSKYGPLEVRRRGGEVRAFAGDEVVGHRVRPPTDPAA